MDDMEEILEAATRDAAMQLNQLILEGKIKNRTFDFSIQHTFNYK